MIEGKRITNDTIENASNIITPFMLCGLLQACSAHG